MSSSQPSRHRTRSNRPTQTPSDRPQAAQAAVGARVRAWWRAAPRWQRHTVRGLAAVAVVMLLVPLAAGPVVGLVARTVDVDVSGADLGESGALDERSIVRDASGDHFAVLHDEIDRRVVDLSDIPEHVQEAVLAAEDQRFYEHDGYDTRAIARAAAANLRAGTVDQGASTITQQVARQIFLSREVSFARKAEELVYAVALEQRYDKDQILERYLNEVYFGSGAYGVAAAAEQYFRLQPHQLAPEQAALLAGMIRSPVQLNPREHPDRARARRNQVLETMAEAGFLERAEAERLQSRPIAVEPRLQRTPADPYALEAIKREFVSLEEFGDNVDERFQRLFSGGYEIHTTIDRDLQQLADEVITARLPPEQAGPTAALVALDPRNEAIRALHGGVDFDETQFDLATQARRQPGSALKPLVAASALENGVTPDATFEGNGPLAFSRRGASEPWKIDNFGARDHGTVDLSEATAQSVNTAFAQLILAVGVENVVETADRLGVNTGEAFGPENSWGPSIALGGLTHGITPLELASVFGTFADRGRTGPPYLIERVESPSGEVVYERQSDVRTQAIDPSVNATMVDLLRGVVDRGTGQAAQLQDWEVLGKTGTTDDNTDAWFGGATATLSTAVWVGHPDEQVPMGGMTGGSLPAELWRAFNADALAGHQPQPLPDEGGEPLTPDSAEVPDLTGLPLGNALVEAGRAGLIGQVQGFAGNPNRIVRSQSPSPGAHVDKGESVLLRFSTASSGGQRQPPQTNETDAPPTPTEQNDSDETDEEETSQDSAGDDEAGDGEREDGDDTTEDSVGEDETSNDGTTGDGDGKDDDSGDSTTEDGDGTDGEGGDSTSDGDTTDGDTSDGTETDTSDGDGGDSTTSDSDTSGSTDSKTSDSDSTEGWLISGRSRFAT